ncbi:tetratricopeptide repeat-containing sulfotransferase family protein [Sphingomonas oligophenolica]|uniref:Sulfotransferase n=1 Tax=Sphingomonas oligophenolica TaxID=301154 RepID=A0ABU9Y4Z8_9SPHN
MNTQIPIGAPAQLEQEIARLRRMQDDGRHEAVLAQLCAPFAAWPEARDLLLIEAVSLRHLGRIDEALASVDRLALHHPRFSLMHQERGLCHVARKDAPAAIAALLEAVNINLALPMSWKMLAGLYRITGDTDNAAIAAGHVAALQALPPPVVAATALFFDGDLAPAEAMIRAFLLAHGDHPEAMRLLAKIGLAHKVYDDAELLLAGVLEMMPDHRAARFEYAQALTYRHKYAEARAALAPLLAAEPTSHDFRELASTIAVGLGRHDEAIALYRAMLAQIAAAPAGQRDAGISVQARADLNLWLGHALKTVGELLEAIAAYRASIAARPDFGDAWWSLANLKRYFFTDAEITSMRAVEALSSTAAIDRVHLCFALGKALEDRGEIADSWLHYERGNALQRAESRYRPEILETNTRQQIAVCTSAFFENRAGWGIPDRDPIFILGLPRSGSTLIEQILASHSQVEGTQELADVQRIVLDLQGRDPGLDNPRYPAVLADLTRDDIDAFGRRYRDDTRVYRSGRSFFIDKMPNNFRHIGLIHLMLPNATIIDARRDPISCCFSNLKQLFAQGQEFSYGVDDIARYYRTYLDLMEHWDRVLPGRVLRVQHEDVVDDLDGSVRRILDHVGLDFEAACIAFHQNRRSVRTPSSEQVRQPIFRDGLDQWKKYEPWLEPLKEALGDAMVRYRS